jgi:two-component system cell cycle response regulator
MHGPSERLPRRTVLIVDDDPSVHRLLDGPLRDAGLAVEAAETAADAERRLGGRPVELIVLDLVLPDADGRTLLARLREDPRTSAIPVIVLSGHLSPEARAECFALGCETFIVKPFDPAAVRAAAAAILERAAQVRFDARRDPVTSLANRAAFREAFDRATARRTARRGGVCVALLELDQYRTLAATSGWGTADRALAFAARALARSLHAATLVARWSGGAFAALLTGSDEAKATTLVGGAMRAAGAAAEPDGQGGTFTFSAGVAEWAAGASLEDTLAEAESQMVAARAAGGDAACSAAHPGRAVRRVVVLAEDDDLIASVVKRRLEREGFTVKHFVDGAKAAAAAPRLRPSLAILDATLAGADGFELVRKLRAATALTHLPIMMLTPVGRDADVMRGHEVGADDYVVKPFSPAELVARVHRLLLRR